MRELKYLKIWLIVGWALVGLVIFVSVTPRAPEMLDLDGADKLLHVFAYGIMMLWFGFIYLPSRMYQNLGIILIAIGIALELIQGIIAHRSLSFLDMVANTVGVLLGWLLAKTRLSSTLNHVENILHSGNK
jgi:hypothetical protein